MKPSADVNLKGTYRKNTYEHQMYTKAVVEATKTNMYINLNYTWNICLRVWDMDVINRIKRSFVIFCLLSWSRGLNWRKLTNSKLTKLANS